MNGFILLIPFFIIRFGLLSFLSKDGVKRAAHFAKMIGNEVLAFYIYQISNIAILLYLCFIPIIVEFSLYFYIGITIYIFGLMLCTLSIINYAKPSSQGLNSKGIYRFSRNPMYLSYFLYFIGCTLLTQSLLLLLFILVFQISTHWIILSEERWCINKFGDEYKQYMKMVRRYI